jgi:hypothetical protein
MLAKKERDTCFTPPLREEDNGALPFDIYCLEPVLVTDGVSYG